MRWFRKEKPTPEIPKFEPPRVIEAKPKPAEAGIVVEENRDPSDSMILRIVKAIRERD